MVVRKMLGAWALAAIMLSAHGASGNEPAQAFLNALRERNYFDTALEYLATAEKNPAIPDSFKEAILYERATTLIKSAQLQRDAGRQAQQLDEAQAALQEFVKAKPRHLYAAAARSQLGDVMLKRAYGLVVKAKKANSAEAQTLNKQARDLYDEANKLFTTLVEELRAKLKTYPAALDEKTDAQRFEERDRFRQDFLNAQLLAANTREDMADTFGQGSKEQTQALTAAAEAYKAIYENYRTRIAGLYARAFQARCLQKLGKHKEASAFFSELLENKDKNEAIRELNLKVMALAVESWIAQQQYAEVVDRAAAMIDAAPPGEERSEDMMSLRLNVAKAAKAYADQLKAKNPRDPDIRRVLSSGRQHVTYLTKVPNSHQEEAKKLLAEYAGVAAAATETPKPRADAKTFAEAKAAAKDAIDAVQTGEVMVKALSGRLAAGKADNKDEQQKQLAEAKQQVTKYQTEAEQLCRLALKMADRETAIDDVNLVRYWLCFMLYGEKRYYDAIAIGDFLARRYPDNQGARQCAAVVLASLVNLHAANLDANEGGEESDFEAEQVVKIGDYIVKQWPDQPEAMVALNTLIPFMIRAKQLDAAQSYLAKIPSDSPQRASAELKMGQALWGSYLEGARSIREWESGVQPKPENVDLAARKKELDELKAKARQTLVEGVERMQKAGDSSRSVVTAALSLAQIYVDTSEATKAVSLLEEAKIGPLTLVESRDAAAQEDAIAEETYKTYLRALISSLATPGTNVKQTIDKARKCMESLKKRMQQNPQGQQRLVTIYFSLANDLKRQMEIADPATKKALSEAFETFLKEVAADATELNVLTWVGDTYLGMGEAFGANLSNLTPQAKNYFSKAAESYQKILEKGKSDASFLTPAMQTSVRIKLAKAKKDMGDYIAAGDIFESILIASPTLLPAQIEAARLYQDWGGTGKGRQDNYVRAIAGARPNKDKANKNTIWGWGEIARMTANNGQFSEQFYDARYNLAFCRYQFALAQEDPMKKTEQLQKAKNDIALMVGLYPELGGDEKRKQYDGLLKNIQKSLGERADGLKSLKASATPGKAAASTAATK